jgi:hypothetical protein
MLAAPLPRGFVYFSQTDPSWEGTPYTTRGASDQTIGKSGCVPTLQAMVAANLCDLAVTPPDLAKWNIDNGMRTETKGTRRASWNLLVNQLGLNIKTVEKNEESLEVALQIGGLVVASLKGADSSQLSTPSGHVIGLRAVNNSGVLIVDSNSQANSERPWSYEEISPFVNSGLRHIYHAEADLVTSRSGLRMATLTERQVAEQLAYDQDRSC